MNVAICRKDTGEIKHFVRDCYKIKDKYIGTNTKVDGVNINIYNIVWTNDDATEITEGKWDKVETDLTAVTDTSAVIDVPNVGDSEYLQAVQIRNFISSKNYQQIDSYIETNVTDLPSSKVFLKELTKVVLALCKIVDSK